MTDEHASYKDVGGEFASHDAVNHGKDEYVRYWNEVTDKTRPDGKPVVERPLSPPTQLKATIRSSSAA
jgi:hypothetical protein